MKQRNGISILGYGCMRFTRNGNTLDFDKADKEFMRAVELGVNYFDTAYIYPGNEDLVGRIIEKNGIRDKINLATKLPQYLINNRAALDKYFAEELKRLRTDYVDYYLMHHMTDYAQWEKLKEYAHKKGVKFIGDIPIYVALDSADVWSEPRFFQLDEKNVPKAVAGVPPDPFTADGQLWGNPLYNWDALEKYVEKPVKSTILVICHKNGTIDRRKKLVSKAEAVGVVFESKKKG